MDKTKGGWRDKGKEVGMAGVGGVKGGEWRQLYLNNNKKMIKKSSRNCIKFLKICYILV